jgi:hypothetical protein
MGIERLGRSVASRYNVHECVRNCQIDVSVLLIQLLVRTTSYQKFNRLLLKAKSLPSHTQRITAPQSLRISKSTI